MECFGKDEMEVLDVDADPSKVRDFLASMAGYVLEYDAVLNDGETIGFSAVDKHRITRGQGVALPDKVTLKISYGSEVQREGSAVRYNYGLQSSGNISTLVHGK